MSPSDVVYAWVNAFNKADVEAITDLYHPDAVNYQVPESEVVGREKIRLMFEKEFATANMVCHVENVFEDGEWAILEWSDPVGLRGCGFFHITGGRIRSQRGYWDKLSFLKLHGLPFPERRPAEHSTDGVTNSRHKSGRPIA